MATRTYDVPEISCNHCKQTIESAVSDLDDVSAVEVDVDTRTVRVDGDVSEDTVRSTLDAAGYDVAGVS